MHTLGFKILVVDDDPQIRALLVELLETEGYSVITADNGLNGILKATAGVDLIILDMMMPVFDGLSVRKALKDNPETEHIPVLFLSGYDDDGIRRSCAKFSHGVFRKPVDCRELLARIHELAAERAAVA